MVFDKVVRVVPWPVTVLLRLPNVVPWLVSDVLRPASVVLRPETVVPSAAALLCNVPSVVLIVLRLLARFATWVMATGKVAYWVEPVPPVGGLAVPSVLVCRTAASDRAVVLGGTCQVSVQEATPLLLV